MKLPYRISDHFKIYENFLTNFECIQILENIQHYQNHGEILNLPTYSLVTNILKCSKTVISNLIQTEITNISSPEFYCQTDKVTIRPNHNPIPGYIGIIFLKSWHNKPDLDPFNEIYGGIFDFITHDVSVKPTSGTLLMFKNAPNNVYRIQECAVGYSQYIKFLVS